MQSFKQDSLSCLIHSSPWFKPLDRSSVSLPSVVKSLNEYMNWKSPYPDGYGLVAGTGSYGKHEGISGSPEVDALVFYMLNHAVSVITQKTHPYASLWKLGPVVELYREQLAIRSTRMFFYLLLICTRESRHAKNSHSDPVMQGLSSKYGSDILDFWNSIKGSGSSGAADKLMKYPPDVLLGNYVRFIQELFYKGSFSGGYGGKAWGKVTDCLVDYVTGKFSAEMMMDTAFTLCHNNGPIFNKGMLFDTYSHEIYKILDVQRSGQIPVMIANKETSFHNNPVVSSLMSVVRKVLPDIFEGWVDWYKVESLGSLKKYPQQKADQLKLHGAPSGVAVGGSFDKPSSTFGKPVPKNKLFSPGNHVDDAAFEGDEFTPASYNNYLQIMPDVKVAIVEVR